jgi:hypothetical protein
MENSRRRKKEKPTHTIQDNEQLAMLVLTTMRYWVTSIQAELA